MEWGVMIVLADKIREFIQTQTGRIAVVVKNLETNEEIKINEDLTFPAASTIKLFVMAALLNKVEEGVLNLEHTIELTEDMRTGGDGILKELFAGQRISLAEVMTLMITVSDNMATNILIDLLGMSDINAIIKALGLNHTKLQRRMMDFQAIKEGRDNLITANDLAYFLEVIYFAKNIDKNHCDRMLDILKKQQIKGRLDLYLPKDTLIAHKAGDLDRLEHDAGIVFLKDAAYIICVLTNKIATNEEGREIIGRISEIVYQEYCSMQV